MRSPALQPEPGFRSTKRRTHHAALRRERDGLTLVELAVTLSVLMLAAVVAVPSFLRFQQASQLQWSARRTMALAAEARGLAVSGDTVVRLEYDPQAHGMRMVVEPPEEDSDDVQATEGTEPPVNERRTPDTRFLPLPLDLEVKVEREKPSEAASLRFYPDGRSDDVQIRMEQEGFRPVVLAMNARTGRLRIEEPTE